MAKPEPTLEGENDMMKFQALGSAVALALAGTMIAVPAMARTHHPSTRSERAQTKDLNVQQLAIAQGQAPPNQQAMNGNAPAQQDQNANQNQNVPTDQMKNGGQTAQAPAAGASPPAGQAPANQAPSSQ
jgi:hypothetical protein